MDANAPAAANTENRRRRCGPDDDEDRGSDEERGAVKLGRRMRHRVLAIRLTGAATRIWPISRRCLYRRPRLRLRDGDDDRLVGTALASRSGLTPRSRWRCSRWVFLTNRGEATKSGKPFRLSAPRRRRFVGRTSASPPRIYTPPSGVARLDDGLAGQRLASISDVMSSIRSFV